MNPLPPSVVTIVDGEMTIDAEALAPKLGLTLRSLKEEMRKGLVYSVAETGVGEDAGRSRLTFCYRAQVWRVVVEPDGTLVEILCRSRKRHRRPTIASVCLTS